MERESQVETKLKVDLTQNSKQGKVIDMQLIMTLCRIVLSRLGLEYHSNSNHTAESDIFIGASTIL